MYEIYELLLAVSSYFITKDYLESKPLLKRAILYVYIIKNNQIVMV